MFLDDFLTDRIKEVICENGISDRADIITDDLKNVVAEKWGGQVASIRKRKHNNTFLFELSIEIECILFKHKIQNSEAGKITTGIIKAIHCYYSGCENIYISKLTRKNYLKRDAEIIDSNQTAKELASEYGLSERRIRQIIARGR